MVTLTSADVEPAPSLDDVAAGPRGDHVPPYARCSPTSGSTGTPKIIVGPSPGIYLRAEDLAASVAGRRGRGDALRVAALPQQRLCLLLSGVAAGPPGRAHGALRRRPRRRPDRAPSRDVTCWCRRCCSGSPASRAFATAISPACSASSTAAPLCPSGSRGVARPRATGAIHLRVRRQRGARRRHVLGCGMAHPSRAPTGLPVGCDCSSSTTTTSRGDGRDRPDLDAARHRRTAVQVRRHDTPAPIIGGYRSYGDMGSVDDDGYLYIADRRQDMIVTGGANVFPAEVEAALSEHAGIADAVVIGLPDPEWGHRVHAIVEPADRAGRHRPRTSCGRTAGSGCPDRRCRSRSSSSIASRARRRGRSTGRVS